MLTSIPQPQILFIDGLPGSGKSTAAGALGDSVPASKVFVESAPDHPLLVGRPDRMGAAFADIHEIYSVGSFAAAALERLETFLEGAGHDVLYVFESWEQPSQTFTRYTLLVRLPLRRSKGWKHSWKAPVMMCCTSLRAIPSRARFGCFFSWTRLKRRYFGFGRICRNGWPSLNLG
ncbi:hypothetical protein [Bradyrhizobium liaoningense]